MDAVEQIREQGYTILKGIIPEDKLTGVRNDIIEAADKFGTKKPKNTYLATTINHAQSFAPYVADPQIMAIVESFFGPYARVSSTSTQINEPGNERGDWHSDWPFCPLNAGHIPKPIPDSVMHLTSLFMLVGFTRENGGTLMRPSSHKWGTNPTYDYEQIYDDYPDQIHGEGSAGSVLIMDSRLWHASAVNHTNERRAALVVRYAPWWLNLDVLMPGSRERKIIVDEPGIFGSSYPAVTQEAYDRINDIAKPLFRHWIHAR